MLASLRNAFAKIIFVSLVCSSTFMSACKQSNVKTSHDHSSGVQVVKTPGSSIVSAYLVFDQSTHTNFPDGLAHYTEHLVWGGVLLGPSKDATQHSNAWTNNRTIGYWLYGTKKDLPELLRSLSKVFEPISVTPEYAKEELDIVIREYDLGVVNSVDTQAHQLLSEFLYKNNVTARTVIGTPEEIAKFQYADALALYEAIHQPDNAKLVVMGDVTEKEVLRTIAENELFKLSVSYENSHLPVKIALAELEKDAFNFSSTNSESRLKIRKVVTLDKAIDFDTLHLQTRLLSDILISNIPGGLAGPLRYDNFIARSFHVDVFPLDEKHIELFFEATADSGVTLKQLQAEFEKVFYQSQNGIPVDSFNRVLNRFDSYWPDWDNSQKSTDWMKRYVLHSVSNLREPKSKKELVGLSKHLTLQNLDVLLSALQKPGREAVAYIGNNNGENE